VYPVLSAVSLLGIIFEVGRWTGYVEAFNDIRVQADPTQLAQWKKFNDAFETSNNNRYYFLLAVLMVTSVIRNLEWIGVVKSDSNSPKDE
jgi:hypothetical protein